MAAELKPAYLIAGGDEVKTEAALRRLRARAEQEGGALETHGPRDGSKGPDLDELEASLAAIPLIAGRRIVLVEAVERLGKAHQQRLAGLISGADPALTLVLVSRAAAPASLAAAVEQAGGQLLRYEAPRERSLAAWLVAKARERGFALDADAAQLLVQRLGVGQLRLANELDRLALWARDRGRVGVEDLHTLGDTAETASWELADAVVAQRPQDAVGVAERLLAEGQPVGALIYQLASRLRHGHQAAAALAAGRPPKEVAQQLKMHPYAAKLLVRAVRDVDPARLRTALMAVADLEAWTRGEADYGDGTALVVAVRRAAGGTAASDR